MSDLKQKQKSQKLLLKQKIREWKQLKENFNDILAINQAASLCVSRSIARGVYHASNSNSDIFPSFKNKFKIKVS